TIDTSGRELPGDTVAPGRNGGPGRFHDGRGPGGPNGRRGRSPSNGHGAGAPPGGAFARLGRWCFRRRRYVVAIWLLVAVLGGALLGAIGTNTQTEFSLPDVESRRGTDILDEHFGG